MKKLLITIITVLFLSINTFSHAQIEVIPEKIQELVKIGKLKIDNAVSITSIKYGGIYTCSGTVIKNTPNESIVLTAKHCVGVIEELYVEDLLAISVGTSMYDDIAYIKLNKKIPNKQAVKISEIVPQNNDLIIIVGYPNMKLFISFGIMKYKTKDWQFANIDVKPGVSGAGVYNEYGELVGIVWGGLGDPDKEDQIMHTSIFERYQDLINFIKENNLL